MLTIAFTDIFSLNALHLQFLENMGFKSLQSSIDEQLVFTSDDEFDPQASSALLRERLGPTYFSEDCIQPIEDVIEQTDVPSLLTLDHIGVLFRLIGTFHEKVLSRQSANDNAGTTVPARINLTSLSQASALTEEWIRGQIRIPYDFYWEIDPPQQSYAYIVPDQLTFRGHSLRKDWHDLYNVLQHRYVQSFSSFRSLGVLLCIMSEKDMEFV